VSTTDKKVKEWERAWEHDWMASDRESFRIGWHKAVDFIIKNADCYVEGGHYQEDMVLRIKASLEGKEEWWKDLP